MPTKPKKKRASKAVPTSREDFDRAVEFAAYLQVHIAELETARDAEKQAHLDRHNTPIDNCKAQLKEMVDFASAYASAHRDELFSGDAKSAASKTAVFGFRTGQPTLKKIRGVKETEAELATELAESAISWASQVVQTKHTLRKPAVLQRVINGCEWLGHFFRVEQTERFFIESKAQQERSAE